MTKGLLLANERPSPEQRPYLVTECCNRLVLSTTRYCPTCGYECRVQPLEELS